MDTAKINEMLHRDNIQQRYCIHVGNNIVVIGPRIPMTRYTEFVSVEPEKQGDINSFHVYTTTSNEGEGHLALQNVGVQSVGPGTLHLSFVAKDSLTGEAIEGVEPVNVTIEAA